MTTSFSINFDYRCPFARNANEHVIAALRDGAPYEVTFKAFSQSQGSVEEGMLSVWDDPTKRRELTALAVGIVVRDRFPEHFFDADLSLFALRHDDGEDIREEAVVRKGLDRAGVDSDLVFKELEESWAFDRVRAEHEESVARYQVFGVPTFISGGEVVFVRLMKRPAGDVALTRTTVDRLLDLLVAHPEINEYKHTTVPF